MKYHKTFFIVSSLLALLAFTGCSTVEAVGEKTNEQRIDEQRTKISQLRGEDAIILSEIDGLLSRCEGLVARAEREREDDPEHAKLVLDTAEAVLVQANTRRLWAVRRASYKTAQEAYLERANRIQRIREAIEKQLPVTREDNQ